MLFEVKKVTSSRARVAAANFSFPISSIQLVVRRASTVV